MGAAMVMAVSMMGVRASAAESPKMWGALLSTSTHFGEC